VTSTTPSPPVSGAAQRRDDRGDDLFVDALQRARLAFMRRKAADLALEPGRIGAVDRGDIGSESEIGDNNGLRPRHGRRAAKAAQRRTGAAGQRKRGKTGKDQTHGGVSL
jgi:hypothetical protein